MEEMVKSQKSQIPTKYLGDPLLDCADAHPLQRPEDLSWSPCCRSRRWESIRGKNIFLPQRSKLLVWRSLTSTSLPCGWCAWSPWPTSWSWSTSPPTSSSTAQCPAPSKRPSQRWNFLSYAWLSLPTLATFIKTFLLSIWNIAYCQNIVVFRKGKICLYFHFQILSHFPDSIFADDEIFSYFHQKLKCKLFRGQIEPDVRTFFSTYFLIW